MPAPLLPNMTASCSSITLADYCLDVRDKYNAHIPLSWTDNALLCGVFPGLPFVARLRALPNLRSVTMTKHNYVPHGLPWDTVRAILSLPNLRYLQVELICFCPVLRPGDDLTLHTDSVAPLTSFRYHMDHLRQTRSYPSEITALTTILENLCNSLETLVLTSEIPSLPDLARMLWPRLRKLVFYGNPFPSAIPVPTLCAGMPGLRCLSFKLNPPPDTVPQPLWPSGLTGPSLPDLERLVISYPDPQDEIFDHIPATLRSLSLRCWPHVDVQLRGPGYPPNLDVVLNFSTALSILRRCGIQTLDHLELEYITEAEDDATLLDYIARAFPSLSSLKLYRHRPNYASVPVVSDLDVVCSSAANLTFVGVR